MAHIKTTQLLLTVCIAISSATCSTIPSKDERTKYADRLASDQNWQRVELNTSPLKLTAYEAKPYQQNNTLIVYLEGDGFAWRSKRKSAINPTPINPIGLKLALHHKNGTAVYLARPCQYSKFTPISPCETRFWTTHRFSTEIISSYMQALDTLKSKYRSNKFILIGYSGGASVAALLANKRKDIIRIITVAGNLDHKRWTDWHKISPLTGSLNPANQNSRLSTIEQTHLVGSEDKIVPPELTTNFVSQNYTNSLSKVVIIQGQSHHCCWDTIWPNLSRYHQLTFDKQAIE